MSGSSQAQSGLMDRRTENVRDGDELATRNVVTTGNSKAVTIPPVLARLLGLETGDEVTLYKCDGGYYVEAKDGDE